MLDYTKLVEKINPERDGEPYTHLRAGTVSVVNADGTLDILMASGVLVPSVPKLASAYVTVGDAVQMISFRGSLLVLGAVASVSAINNGQVIAYSSADTDSSAGASGVEVSMLTVTGTLQANHPYRVWAEFHATPSAIGSGAVRIRLGSGIAGTELRVAFADFPSAGTAGNHFFLSSRYTPGSSGSQTFTATAQVTSQTVRREAASTRLSEMWITG